MVNDVNSFSGKECNVMLNVVVKVLPQRKVEIANFSELVGTQSTPNSLRRKPTIMNRSKREMWKERSIVATRHWRNMLFLIFHNMLLLT